MLDKVIGDRFGLIPPISFYGKSHTKENAHELFAVVVDAVSYTHLDVYKRQWWMWTM